jgi:hypothetical protein
MRWTVLLIAVLLAATTVSALAEAPAAGSAVAPAAASPVNTAAANALQPSGDVAAVETSSSAGGIFKRLRAGVATVANKIKTGVVKTGKFLAKATGVLAAANRFDQKFLGGKARLAAGLGAPSCKGMSDLECEFAQDRYEEQRRKLTDAKPYSTVAELPKYTDRRVIEVKPTGPEPQLPGDQERNEDNVKAVKFDLRWAKSIKQKHIDAGNALIPTTDKQNEKFRESQARNNRLPLIAPHLFNGRR